MADTPVAAAVQAVVENKPEVVAPTADPRLDALARKERQLYQQHKKMKAEIESERAALRTRQTDYETNYVPKSRLTEDPLSVLSDNGITYEKLTEMLLSGHNSQDPAYKALKSEIRAIREQHENEKKQAQENAQQQQQQVIESLKQEAKVLVDTNPEFETIKSLDLSDAVSELIVETFNSEGRLMDVEEAAREVEAHLVEQGIKFNSIKKIQDKLKPSAPVSAETNVQSQPGPQIKTLTNSLPSQVAKRASDKERRERAMAAFRGEVK